MRMASGSKMIDQSLSSSGKIVYAGVGANHFIKIRDMNYWVNARRRRKFQFISNRPNLLKNFIWPIELWSQLLMSFEF